MVAIIYYVMNFFLPKKLGDILLVSNEWDEVDVTKFSIAELFFIDV